MLIVQRQLTRPRFETPVVSLILGGRLTRRLMAFPARVLVYRHISRVPGADVPGAFASKLGRGEVKAWPRESLIHLP